MKMKYLFWGFIFLLGVQMGEVFGIKVSKLNASVFQETPDNVAFSSKHNSLKIVQKGLATVTVPAGTPASGTLDIKHGLGYIPHVLVFVSDNDVIPGEIYETPFTELDPGYDYTVSNEIIRFRAGVETNASPYQVFFYYYIFADEG